MLSLYYDEVAGVENVMLLGISRNMTRNGRTVRPYNSVLVKISTIYNLYTGRKSV